MSDYDNQRNDPLLDKASASESQSQSQRDSIAGMGYQSLQKSEGQMKLDQFMLRFRDEVALKRERNRDE